MLLGKTLYLEGRTAEAEDRFNALYDAVSDDEKNETALWIAGIYYSLKAYERGLHWAKQLGEDVPVKARLISYFLFRAGEIKKAIEAGRRAIQQNDEDPAAHLLLASALSKDLENRRGLDRLRVLFEFQQVAERAAHLNPGNASAQRFLETARLQTDLERFSLLIGALNFVRRRAMTHPKTWGLVWSTVLFLGSWTPLLAQEEIPEAVVGSTYWGGEGGVPGRGLAEFFFDVAVHPSGDIIAVGGSSSPELAAKHGAQFQGERDAFVLRADPLLQNVVSVTFFGGASDDRALCLTIALDGTVIVGGYTTSSDFPVTDGAVQNNPGDPDAPGDQDAFIVRVDTEPDENRQGRILYSTLLGGRGEESCVDIAVDPEMVVTAVGYTADPDFPVTVDTAFQPDYGGGEYDTFLVQLRPDDDAGGELKYSTFIGGDAAEAHPERRDIRNNSNDVSLGPGGVVTLMGFTMSRNFPWTPGAFNTQHNGMSDVYVIQLDLDRPPAEQLRYSTFLGGWHNELPDDVTTLADGTLLLAGATASSDFPIRGGGMPERRGYTDAFLSVLRPDAVPPSDQLVYSTVIGDIGYDDVFAMAYDPARKMIYLTGGVGRPDNGALPDVPILPNALRDDFEGRSEVFLSLFEWDEVGAHAVMLYSTFLGGQGYDRAWAMSLLPDGDIVVGGMTDSCDFFPIRADALQPECGGGWDAFLTRLRLDLGDPRFIRGDCNFDGQVNIADATWALGWLFAGDAAAECRAALNTNGDDKVDIADPVFLLNFLFAGGPGLTDPYPDCGPFRLPADRELGCEIPTECS